MFARVSWLFSLAALLAACSTRTPDDAAQPKGPAQLPATQASKAEVALTADQQQGKELYLRMCAVCHGDNGEGYKADRAPALRHPEFLASVSDPFLRHAIADGRKGTTMSAWSKERGGPLSQLEINNVRSYLRTWESKPRAKLNEAPLLGDAKRGESLYLRECARCHGPRGVSGPFIHLAELGLMATATNGFLRHAIREGRSGTEMAAYAQLGDPAIDDLVAYLRALEREGVAAAQAGATPAAQPARPAPLPLGKIPLNPKGPAPVGFQEFPGTTKADVIFAQLERGARMVLMDARAPSDYTNEHITGAVSVPFYDPTPYLDKLPKNVWLVSYCACPHAESMSLAQKLKDAGFTKVTVLDEGLGYWKSKNYGTHSGADTGTRPK
jgi:cytochrome c oxidase cbb3-type subunit III